MDGWSIGSVARRTGLTERTLRYYEELGLLEPARDTGGRRRYGSAELAVLYRIRLQRELGTAMADVDPGEHDLLAVTRRHLRQTDSRMAELARQRERVRAVEDRLLGGDPPSDEALLDLLAGLGDDQTGATRRITLLVYRDLAAAHRWLVDVLGLRPGELTIVDDRAVHGEVYAGDGVIWLHREAPEHGMFSPLAVGGVTASLAVDVDDVDAHHARVRDAGAEVVGPPVDQPYGYREYSVRDPEGHLWSFQQPIPEDDDSDE